MGYIECSIQMTPFRPWNEIIVAQLGEIGFESFVEEILVSKVKAYILENEFDQTIIKEVLNSFKPELEYTLETKSIEKENWNRKWEENFDSVEVGSFCYVRAPFHEHKSDFDFEIVIEPKMSFGTGHHQTTQMMIELMSEIDFKGKSVLDMGSGTGILAILAKKMGATIVDAIDIEEWAYENMKENFERNNSLVNAYLGNADQIGEIDAHYDIIIANINKNILLEQFSIYNRHLNVKGDLLLSGFYQSDAEDLRGSESINNYVLVNQLVKMDWCGLHLKKQ